MIVRSTKHMKTNIVLLLAILALAVPLHAEDQQPSQTAVLAEELMTLFQIDKNMDAALQQVGKMREQMAATKDQTPEAKAKQQQMSEAINKEIKSVMSWEKIKPMFISIYAETFTAEELQGMITFFKSPLGRKWIEKQPQLQMATMQKMQAVVMEMQPKMQEAIKRVMEAQKETK
jgi:uncharacterized protein